MGREGVKGYFLAKKDELAIILADKNQNLRRLEAQRNELNAKGTQCVPLFKL
jgi:26S proteasome regulatory subunit T6